MIDSKSKSYFLKWLFKVKDSGRVLLTNVINLDTKKYLLQNFWNEKYFQKYQSFDESESIYLLELFKVINNTKGKL